MTKLLSLTLLCLTAACSGAQTPTHTPVSPINQASVVQPAAANSEVAPNSDATLMQTLASRRELNLDRLLAYANAREFPRNTVSNGPLNLFVDDQGHICAAANLIHLDGQVDLVKQTASRDNYIVLANVTGGPLFDWMLNSGFTQEEIGLIQEPYMPITQEVPQQPAAQPVFATAPVFATPPVSYEEEADRVQAVLLGVHKLLSANTKKSLGIAVARHL